MTDGPVPSPGTPHELLDSVHRLTRQVREAQRGAWFPLGLLGLLTLGAIPADRYGHYTATCQSFRRGDVGGQVCTISDTWSFIYWTTALVLAYAVIAYFSVRRSRARGVGTAVRPYIAAGIGIAAALTAAAIWAVHHPPGLSHEIWGLRLDPQSSVTAFLYRLAAPAGAIGLALLVLSWVERNLALAAFTLLYLAIVLVPVTFGWTIARPSPWFFLPHLTIAAALLLLGSVGFALAQSVRRPAGDG
ncbi:hypothetical protein J4573_39370 [Actinomadura barringtoniae]|uniref:DUF998 domain-containing protein n=1 Tax=Actinomadura barringtoniae TaxID=1427535 RepID=A0A939PNK0_9ACTN|nr:hypothetical protein [Actinomadura barringtoniae]MBO2453209.1 hypothetical protein [Actinomadura barringtoniae]